MLARLPVPAAAFGPRKDFIAAVRKHRIKFVLGRRLKFPDNSLDGFYTSRALEHMPREECFFLLSNVRRWLKPSGVLRVVLPDLRRFATSYVSQKIDAEKFVQSLGLAADDAKWWSIVFRHSYHRWMYDAQNFCDLLSRLGYRHVRECAFRQGAIPEVAYMDLPGRSADSFYVEGN